MNKRTIKNKTCKECKKLLPIEKMESGHNICKSCYLEKYTFSEEQLQTMKDLNKAIEGAMGL